jgi:hypothetical protein
MYFVQPFLYLNGVFYNRPPERKKLKVLSFEERGSRGIGHPHFIPQSGNFLSREAQARREK